MWTAAVWTAHLETHIQVNAVVNPKLWQYECFMTYLFWVLQPVIGEHWSYKNNILSSSVLENHVYVGAIYALTNPEMKTLM